MFVFLFISSCYLNHDYNNLRFLYTAFHNISRLKAVQKLSSVVIGSDQTIIILNSCKEYLVEAAVQALMTIHVHISITTQPRTHSQLSEMEQVK